MRVHYASVPLGQTALGRLSLRILAVRAQFVRDPVDRLQLLRANTGSACRRYKQHRSLSARGSAPAIAIALVLAGAAVLRPWQTPPHQQGTASARVGFARLSTDSGVAGS